MDWYHQSDENPSDPPSWQDELSEVIPPTTRWNPAGRTSRRHGISRTDPNPIIEGGAKPQSDRRWYSRAVRTRETRAICWQGTAHPRSTKERIDELCFICKVDLKTQPHQRKSFPFAVWAESGKRGCPNCEQAAISVRMVAKRFEVSVELLHVATIKVSRPRPPNASIQRIEIALYWVDSNGDNGEHLLLETSKERNAPIDVEAEDPPINSIITPEDQIVMLDEARALLEKCNREHSCQRPSTAFRPTRLIDLSENGDSSQVKLINSDSIPMESSTAYAALSYCWGKALPLRLLKSLLQDMEAGILWEELPPLFQDAVKFTRSLEIRYLWIDALCIMQDDRADWAREASQMGKIYYHSSVTIGASSSKDSNDSLTVAPFRKIKIPWETSRKETSLATCSTVGGDLTWRLHYRGWAFQEILLPSRYLDFDSNSLTLHCAQGTLHSGSGPVSLSSPRSSTEFMQEWRNRNYRQDYRQPWKFRWFWTQIMSGEEKDNNDRPIEKWEAWQEVVMMYTNRRLTFVSDLLPALGGIAAEFLERSEPGQSYCAGLWKSNLVQDLAWIPNDDVIPAKEYQAPSWSWASVCGSVDYPQWDASERTFVTKMVDVAVELRSSNPFGEVQGGFAVVKGPLFQCELIQNLFVTKKISFQIRHLGALYHQDFEPDVDLQISEIQGKGPEGFRSAKRVRGDSGSAPIEENVQCTVFALHLYNGKWVGGLFMILGVVDVAGDEPLFERLGLLKINNSSSVYEHQSGEISDPIRTVKIV